MNSHILAVRNFWCDTRASILYYIWYLAPTIWHQETGVKAACKTS